MSSVTCGGSPFICCELMCVIVPLLGFVREIR